jgi:hypothetical protein
MRFIALAALAASAIAGSALAAEGRFIHPADTNTDDRIDRSEWVAYRLPATEFLKADKNRDGKIDGPEFVAWNTAHEASKAAGAPEHKGH